MVRFSNSVLSVTSFLAEYRQDEACFLRSASSVGSMASVPITLAKTELMRALALSRGSDL